MTVMQLVPLVAVCVKLAVKLSACRRDVINAMTNYVKKETMLAKLCNGKGMLRYTYLSRTKGCSQYL